MGIIKLIPNSTSGMLGPALIEEQTKLEIPELYFIYHDTHSRHFDINDFMIDDSVLDCRSLLKKGESCIVTFKGDCYYVGLVPSLGRYFYIHRGFLKAL